MENNISENLPAVLETVFLFLKNQNFFKSSEAFRNECQQLGITLPNISGKVFFRTNEKISIIENSLCSPRKFIDKRIVLETFLQKDDIETDPENLPNNRTEIDGKQYLKKQFSQLQEEYKNLLAVTAELTNALQVHIVGQTRNINSVLDQCKVIYPSLFEAPMNVTEDGHSMNGSKNVEDEMKHSCQQPNTSGTEDSRNCGDLGMTNADQDLQQKNSFTIIEGAEGTKMEQRGALEKRAQENEDSLGVFTLANQTKVIEDTATKKIPAVSLKPNEEPMKTQDDPCTPVSPREIKDILESVLNRVLYLFKETEKNESNRCCHDKTCVDCTNGVSRILEDILFKVMISPRCETSPNLISCRIGEDVLMSNTDTKNGCSKCNMDEYKINLDSAANELREETTKLERSFDNSNEFTMNVLDSGDLEHIVDGTKTSFVYIGPKNSVRKDDATIPEKLYQNDENQQEIRCDSLDTQFPGMKTYTHSSTGRALDDSEKRHQKSIPNPVRSMKFQNPLCYVEVCQKTQDGKNCCKCAICTPGQSRYYCGCYDLICREIAEEMESISSGSTGDQIKFFKNFYKNSRGADQIPVGNLNNGKTCSTFCGNKICKGAFDSKPRIRRTPPR